MIKKKEKNSNKYLVLSIYGEIVHRENDKMKQQNQIFKEQQLVIKNYRQCLQEFQQWINTVKGYTALQKCYMETKQATQWRPDESF